MPRYILSPLWRPAWKLPLIFILGPQQLCLVSPLLHRQMVRNLARNYLPWILDNCSGLLLCLPCIRFVFVFYRIENHIWSLKSWSPFFVVAVGIGGTVGLGVSSALMMMSSFQWGVRQSAATESHMTSVERLLEYIGIPPEAPLESKPGELS
jgi:hypothetical protein